MAGALLKLQPRSFRALSCIVLVKINVAGGTVDRPLHLKSLVTANLNLSAEMDQLKNGKFYP